jgi:hypothetical protein
VLKSAAIFFRRLIGSGDIHQTPSWEKPAMKSDGLATAVLYHRLPHVVEITSLFSFAQFCPFEGTTSPDACRWHGSIVLGQVM